MFHHSDVTTLKATFLGSASRAEDDLEFGMSYLHSAESASNAASGDVLPTFVPDNPVIPSHLLYIDELSQSADTGRASSSLAGIDSLDDEVEEFDENPSPALELGSSRSAVLNKVASLFSQVQSGDIPSAATQPKNTLKMRAKMDMSKFEKPPVEMYGLNLSQLKKWSIEQRQKLLEEEESKQEVALSKVRGFMEAITKLTKIQSWWRMMGWKKTFNEYRNGRIRIKRDFFGAWRRDVITDKMFLNQVIGKPFRAWASEVDETKRLNALITAFFGTCIKRLKLTPQAVMAFFSEEDFGKLLSENDRTKIRRLILSKLFNGWANDIRIQKTFRYRASLILSRMMRKTKGPMWSKEMTLLFFHMWRRYIAVRVAYRNGEPDPIFKQPYIHQWTLYLQQLTMTRIYKRRAIENGKQLISIRAFRKWRFMMVEDRSKPKDPVATARIHYRMRLVVTMYRAWYGLVREKGRIMRKREKYFLAWKAWAPRKRKLSRIKATCMEMVREKNLVRVFDTMTGLCKESLGRRAATLQVLSKSMYNWRVIMCAHALVDRIPNVLMIDCWRRWCIFLRNRKKFKSFVWQFRSHYHYTRTSVIFGAWKNWYLYRRKNGDRSSVGQNARAGLMALSDDERSIDSVDKDFQLQMVPSSFVHSPTFGHGNIVPMSSRSNLSTPIGSEMHSPMHVVPTGRVSSALQEVSEEGNDYANGGPVQQIVYPSLLPQIMPHSLQIFQRARAAYTPLSADQNAYYLFCEANAFACGIAMRADIESIQALAPVAVNDESASTAEELKRQAIEKKKKLQDALQNAINNLSLEEAAAAVEAGARVYPSQIQYVGKFVGDTYVPLYCYLLASCPMYMAQRVIRGDRNHVVMEVSSPLSAVLLTSQAERWERRDLTGRELTYLVETNSTPVADVVGTNYQSIIMFRCTVLCLLKNKAEDLIRRCILLQSTRTVDEEVVEVMKRQKISRIIAIRDSLCSLLGVEVPVGDLIVPPLISDEPPHRKGFNPKGLRQQSNSAFGDVKKLNIYELLKQYTQITGALTAEAKALRYPMVIRDDRLNKNGFLRQARADFLALRQMCMKPEEIRKQKQKAQDKEMMLKLKREKKFAVKEAERKKQQALELAEKKRQQKQIAHQIALGIYPAKLDIGDDDPEPGDGEQADPAKTTDAVPSETLGTTIANRPVDTATATSNPGQVRSQQRAISGDEKEKKPVAANGGNSGVPTAGATEGVRRKTIVAPAARGVASRSPSASTSRASSASKPPKRPAPSARGNVVMTALPQRQFSFDEDEELESVPSSTESTPRVPDATGVIPPKPKINPLRAIFTKDPTKSTKQVKEEAKKLKKEPSSPGASSRKFLYDGQKFKLTVAEEEERLRNEAGGDKTLLGAKEEHIMALMKAQTSTSIGKQVRKKSALPTQEDDDVSVASEDSSTTATKSVISKASLKEGSPVDDLTAAAKAKAAARMAALKKEKGDDWEENDDDEEENEERLDAGVETDYDESGKESRSPSPGSRRKNSGRSPNGDDDDVDDVDDDDDDDDVEEADEDAERPDTAGDDDDEAKGGNDDDDELKAGKSDPDDDGELEAQTPKEKKAPKKKSASKKGKPSGKSGKSQSKSKGKPDKSSGKSGKGKASRSPSPKPKKQRVHVSKLRDRNILTEEFAMRAQAFKNLLNESWNCKSKRLLDNVQTSLKKRACDQARFVSETMLVKFLNDGGMQQPSMPPEMAGGGLSGWILKKSLTDIAFITAPVWVQFIPHHWWKVPCVYDRLANESILMNTLDAVARLRIKETEGKDVLIQDQQKECMNYLKNARKEVAAIGAKRFQISQEDLGQSLAMKRIIIKSKSNVQKATHALSSFRETLAKAEALLAAGDYDAVFEMYGEGSGYNENVVDTAKLEARAASVIEKQYLNIPKLHQRIVDSEAHVKKAELDVKNFEKSAARVQEMLRRFGEGRFNVVVDVQQIINAIMPTRIKFDDEIEIEVNKLKSIVLYKKMLAKLEKKIHEKGDVMQEELLQLASTGTEADVYEVMYKFQLKNLEAKRLEEELEAEKGLEQHVIASRQEAIYNQLLSDGPVEDDFFDDMSGSQDAMRHFGAPVTGSIPPPGLSIDTSSPVLRTASQKQPGSTRQVSIALGGDLSRMNSTNSLSMQDAGELVDGNNLSDEMKLKLNMSGKSRRAKMKAMEDHLKEVADQMAAEQAREDLRARTFDEYWLCIGPPDKKKTKKSKGSSSRNSSKASPVPGAFSAPSSPSSPMGDNEPSFFDSFLKAPEKRTISLTEKMWKATAAPKGNRGRKLKRGKTYQYRDYSDLDLYDDLSFDTRDSVSEHLHHSAQMGMSRKLDEVLPPTVDSTYVFANPAMWTASSAGSVSMNKSEGAITFEDMGKGKKKAINKNAQDSFSGVGVVELPHFRAARNRVDNLHPDEASLLFENMHDDFDDRTIQTTESKTEAASVGSVKDGRLAPDPNSAAMLIAESLASRPTLKKSPSDLSGKYDIKPGDIESMKRAPPSIAAASRRASSIPDVATVTEDADEEDIPLVTDTVIQEPSRTEENELAPPTPDSSLAGMQIIGNENVEPDDIPECLPSTTDRSVYSALSSPHAEAEAAAMRTRHSVRFEGDNVSELGSGSAGQVVETFTPVEPEKESPILDTESPSKHSIEDDEMSEITLDEAGRLLELQALELSSPAKDEIADVKISSGLDIEGIASPNEPPIVDVETIESARSDITDSDNEGLGNRGDKVAAIDAPVVVIVQKPAMTTEAKEFREDAITAERSNQVKRSTGPVSNAYQLDPVDGTLPPDANIEMMAVEVGDSAIVHEPLNAHHPIEDAVEGVAVFEGGKWVVLGSAVPTPTPKFPGKFKKEKHAELKGLTTSLQADSLGFVAMSNFEPMVMPKPASVVNNDRINNATRVVRMKSPDADPVCRDKADRKSPTPLEKAARAAAAAAEVEAKALELQKKKARKSKPTLTATNRQTNADISGLQLVGIPAINIPIINVLKDDEYLLSDHQLTQVEEVPEESISARRLGQLIGLDESALEAANNDTSMELNGSVSLLTFVESGFGKETDHNAPTDSKRVLKMGGILTRTESKRSVSEDGAMKHTRSPVPTGGSSISGASIPWDGDNSDGNNSSSGGNRRKYSRAGIRPESPEGIDSDCRGSSDLILDPLLATALNEDIAKLPLSDDLNDEDDVHSTADINQSVQRHVYVTNVSSSNRKGSVVSSKDKDDEKVDLNRPHTTHLTSMEPPGKSTSLHSSTEVSAPRKENSWPLFEYSSELRISTPTLSFISDAVRKTVEERLSPDKYPVSPTFAEVLSNRAATILALRDSFDQRVPTAMEKTRKELSRQQDLNVVSQGLVGTTLVASTSRPFSPLGGSQGDDYYIRFRSKRQFGSSIVESAGPVQGKGYDLSSGPAQTKSVVEYDNLAEDIHESASIASGNSAASSKLIPDNVSVLTSNYPYARQPDLELDESVLKEDLRQKIKASFLGDLESPALLEAYATVLGVPVDAFMKKPGGFSVTTAYKLGSGDGYVRNTDVISGDENGSIDLSLNPDHALALIDEPKAVRAPPTPSPTQFDGPAGGIESKADDESVDNSWWSVSRTADDGQDYSTVFAGVQATPLTAASSPYDALANYRPTSRGPSIKVSPFTSISAANANSARYLSMVEFLRTKSRDGGRDDAVRQSVSADGDLGRGSINNSGAIEASSPLTVGTGALEATPAIVPDTFLWRSQTRMTTQAEQILSTLDDQEVEAEIERELREMLRVEKDRHLHHHGSHHKHSSGHGSTRYDQNNQHLSKSLSANEILSKKATGDKNTVRLPQLSKSVTLAADGAVDNVAARKIEAMRKRSMEAMLIKADPAEIDLANLTTKPKTLKKINGAPVAVLSEFGAGLTGTKSFGPKPQPKRLPKESYFIPRRNAHNRDEEEDNSTVMSNLSSFSGDPGGRHKVDRKSSIGIASTSLDGGVNTSNQDLGVKSILQGSPNFRPDASENQDFFALMKGDILSTPFESIHLPNIVRSSGSVSTASK